MAIEPRTDPENTVRRPDSELVLELIILPGEPVRGSVGKSGQSTPRPFHGWIDFMAALNSLRQPDPMDAEPRRD
jgi:hypothetical protein